MKKLWVVGVIIALLIIVPNEGQSRSKNRYMYGYRYKYVSSIYWGRSKCRCRHGYKYNWGHIRSSDHPVIQRQQWEMERIRQRVWRRFWKKKQRRGIGRRGKKR